MAQDLRQFIIRENRQFIQIGKRAMPFAFKRAKQIGGQQLRPFVKIHCAPLIRRAIVETGEIGDDFLDEPDGAAARPFDHVHECPVIFIEQHFADLAEMINALLK